VIDPGLDGKAVLVVGGTGGIGNGIAHAFLAQGARVHVTGTRDAADDYHDLPASDLDGLEYHRLDVRDNAAVSRLYIGEAPLDVLVNCMGIVRYGRAEYDPEVFAAAVDVNLIGAMRCSMRFHEDLTMTKGSIINVGSASCFIATPGQPAYSASTGGLLTLTKSLADAWGRDGVRVNGIAPGFVDTRLTQRTIGNAEAYDHSLRSIPLRRWGTPAEMGGVVVFLASSQASYLTGQMVIADGGLTLR
jgi:3-oxoacyl-[acyl-carrier protein] reductase